MDILIQAAQLVLSLSLLILLHEMGHFLPAKWFNTRVEKFYLFFDPYFSLFKVKRGDTEYGLGWLPLGGYVKISGMMDESMDKDALAEPAKPWEFRAKPAWQRLIILCGGVIVNFILGWVIYSLVLFTYGSSQLPNKSLTDGVWVADSLVQSVGFQTGDKIVSINGTEPVYFSEISTQLLVESADATVVVERNGSEMDIAIPKDFIGQLIDGNRTKSPIFAPRYPTVVAEIVEGTAAEASDLMLKDQVIGVNGTPTPYFDQMREVVVAHANSDIELQIMRNGTEMTIPTHVDSAGSIGFRMTMKLSELEKLGLMTVERKEYSLAGCWGAGASLAAERLDFYIQQVKLVLTPGTGAIKGVGGFAAIGGLFPKTWSWEAFWNITAFLSLMLGFMNILPIPALDGGHVMFVLYEMVVGKKAPEKFMEYAQLAGFVLLLTLIIAVNGNDIYRWLFT